ncbi:MAG: twin-arginine translocation signal domain-containing protein, partial [Planctomycetes bacterium]|nr:twin-arginine translocation signal domain-containing protein [Planctomycetota bacterium]
MRDFANDGNQSRRNFLKAAGLGTAACMACLADGGTAKLASAAEPEKRKRPLTLSLASYTTRKFDLDQTLVIAKRAGLEVICLKSFHLPMNATPEQIAAVRAKVEEAGIKLYGGGVIGLKNQQQIDQAFEYAKAAGMTKIIGGPVPEMLPAIEKKVQQYDIEVCIHNHGPGDS